MNRCPRWGRHERPAPRPALRRSAGRIAGAGRPDAALLATQADVPFVAAGFQPAAVGFLDANLAGSGLHPGIAAQHAGDDFIRRQIGSGGGGQGVTESNQQEQGQGLAVQCHTWPDSMTGVIQ